MILAVTGATGFVGKRLLDQALAGGHRVRALARRPQQPRDGVEWIAGDLENRAALAELIRGADAVIHVAGVVNAPDLGDFVTGNIAGTRAVLRETRAAKVRRFVHVSSLAAREPGLSHYGWSKAEAERLVAASPLDWVAVRPPAVYGPGDRDMLDLFRTARLGLAPALAGRFSAIHVDDLARLLLVLAAGGPRRVVFEVDDGSGDRHGPGLSHAGFARAIGTAIGRRVLPIPVPGALLALAARGDRWWRGDRARLTPDRVGYLRHPDWTVAATRRPPAELWRPRIALRDGLAETARWYREHGLL